MEHELVRKAETELSEARKKISIVSKILSRIAEINAKYVIALSDSYVIAGLIDALQHMIGERKNDRQQGGERRD
mgnify:CR=1 FL=1